MLISSLWQWIVLVKDDIVGGSWEKDTQELFLQLFVSLKSSKISCFFFLSTLWFSDPSEWIEEGEKEGGRERKRKKRGTQDV